jgi:hypothetical protein
MSNFSDQQPIQDPPTGAQINAAVAGDATPMDNSMMKIDAIEQPQTQADSATGAANSSDAATASASVWNNYAHINALWSINQDRNSWVGIAGIGWKKLSTSSESGIVALTMLAATAKEKNSLVYYREESDARIHEFYVW